MNWILASMAALILFGVWSILVKYATIRTDPIPFSFFNTLSSLIVIAGVLGWLWISKSQVSMTQEGISISLIAGVVAILAVLSEVAAFKAGSLSITGPVIAVGALTITVLGGIFLFGETLTIRTGTGVALAFLAIYLLSSA